MQPQLPSSSVQCSDPPDSAVTRRLRRQFLFDTVIDGNSTLNSHPQRGDIVTKTTCKYSTSLLSVMKAPALDWTADVESQTLKSEINTFALRGFI